MNVFYIFTGLFHTARVWERNCEAYNNMERQLVHDYLSKGPPD